VFQKSDAKIQSTITTVHLITRRSIEISVFDLMTLNNEHCVSCRVAIGSGMIFTKFDLRQLIRMPEL